MPIACQSWEIGSGPTVGYKMQGQGGTGTPGSSGHGDGLGLNAIPRTIAAAFIYRPQPQPQPQQQQQQLPQQGESATGRIPIVKFAPCPTTVLVNSRTVYHHHHHHPHQQQQQQQQPQRFAVPSSAGGQSTSTTTNTIATTGATATRLVPPSPSAAGAGKGVLGALEEADEAAGNELNPSMSSSSSIVTSSISADTSDECDDKEVQSAYRGPLEQMDTLMTTLPIRRGLSKFYNGKSRSFASLADVKTVKDLAKPDNPYAKRRKFVSNPVKDNHGKFPPPRLGGISKKTAGSGTTLGLAVVMSGQVHSSTSSAEGNRWQHSSRSLSLTDLRKA